MYSSQGKSQISEEPSHQSIKEIFECKDTCQINFDGKLMKDLPGHKLGKINRLAVTLIQESGPKILSISKTDDSTGEGRKEKLDESWKF